MSAGAEFGRAELLTSTAQATSTYVTSSGRLHPPCATPNPCSHAGAAPPLRRATLGAEPPRRRRAGAAAAACRRRLVPRRVASCRSRRPAGAARGREAARKAIGSLSCAAPRRAAPRRRGLRSLRWHASRRRLQSSRRAVLGIVGSGAAAPAAVPARPRRPASALAPRGAAMTRRLERPGWARPARSRRGISDESRGGSCRSVLMSAHALLCSRHEPRLRTGQGRPCISEHVRRTNYARLHGVCRAKRR